MALKTQQNQNAGPLLQFKDIKRNEKTNKVNIQLINISDKKTKRRTPTTDSNRPLNKTKRRTTPLYDKP
jgi:hypothetical protein